MTATLGVHPDMPDVDYHAHDALSYSGAKMLLPPGCPALYHYRRTHPRPDTAAFDYGHAAHKLVLGIGPKLYAVDAEDWRSKAAREMRDEIRAKGGVPLLAKDMARVEDMAAELQNNPLAAKLLKPGAGTPEASLFWQDDITGVTLRARLDWLPEASGGRMVIPDFKTTKCADPWQFARDAASYRYHMQADFYMRGVRALGLAEDVAFVFIVQEKEPPFLSIVCELAFSAIQAGARLNREAIDLYARCVERDEWPGYHDDDIAYISLPAWATRED